MSFDVALENFECMCRSAVNLILGFTIIKSIPTRRSLQAAEAFAALFIAEPRRHMIKKQ
jgi:hypothetical protein